jgi:hypothetical protein
MFDECWSEHAQQMVMTDKTIDLDQHRGMAAQKATDLCRRLADRAQQPPESCPDREQMVGA